MVQAYLGITKRHNNAFVESGPAQNLPLHDLHVNFFFGRCHIATRHGHKSQSRLKLIALV